MKVAVVLLLVAACGRLGFDARDDGGTSGDGAAIDAPPVPYAPTWISGTRIRARLLQATEGGDPIFIGWHDTLLGTQCTSAPAADGVERCVPGEVRVIDKFSDPGCTQPIAVALDPACGGTDRYAFALDTSDQFHVFPLTGEYAGTVYSNVTGPCAVEGIASYATAYTLGSELAASTFIATEYENRTENGYLRVHAGFTDGSEVLLTSLGAGGRTCVPTGGGLGSTPCREVNLPTLEPVYLDAACSQPAFMLPDPTTAPRFHVEAPRLCGSSLERYLRGADVTQPSHWIRTMGGCVMRGTGANVLYAGTLDTSMPFPAGEVTIGPRRGRLGKLYWTTDGGTTVEMSAFDHERGLPCHYFRGSDNKLRCLPSGPRSTFASADATCTGAALELVGGCYDAAPLDGPGYSTCRDRGFTVQTFGTSYATASAAVDGMCEVLDPPPTGVFSAFAGGTAVPPDMFPALVEIIE